MSSGSPSTSTKPRTICEKMTPEFPRAPISAAREYLLRDRLAAFGGRRLERLDDRAERQDEIRSRVPVGHRIDVEVVDPLAVRFEVLERTPCELAHELELHQGRDPSYATTAAIAMRPRSVVAISNGPRSMAASL